MIRLDTREIKIERIKKGMALLVERGYFVADDIGVSSPKVFEWYCYQAGGIFIFVKRSKRLLCVSREYREYLKSVYKV